jgi:hypothetical protein
MRHREHRAHPGAVTLAEPGDHPRNTARPVPTRVTERPVAPSQGGSQSVCRPSVLANYAHSARTRVGEGNRTVRHGKRGNELGIGLPGVLASRGGPDRLSSRCIGTVACPDGLWREYFGGRAISFGIVRPRESGRNYPLGIRLRPHCRPLAGTQVVSAIEFTTMGDTGLEPVTSCVSSMRSSQLS